MVRQRVLKAVVLRVLPFRWGMLTSCFATLAVANDSWTDVVPGSPALPHAPESTGRKAQLRGAL
jgi:hypothetical protein